MSGPTGGLVIAALLVLANAFFVAAEYALVRVRQTQLRHEADRGDRIAKLGLAMLRQLDEYVSAIQVGVTAASLGLGYVGEPAVFALVAQLIPPLDPVGSGILHVFSFTISFGLVTLVMLVLGELVPKYVTLGNPLLVLRVVALPLAAFRTLISPFVWVARGAALAVVRPLGVRAQPSESETYSEEELRLLLAASARSGVLTRSEEDIVHSAFGFADTPLRNVMVPRTEIAAVEATRTVEELAEVVRTRDFARYPVYRGTLDHVVGIAHSRDLLAVPTADWPKAKVTQLMRRVIPVPEQMRLDLALATMRAERASMLLVVDEFGGTAGIVTVEDIVEQLVGEVHDEFDRGVQFIREQPDGTFLVSGLTPLAEVSERFALELDARDYATVGGLILDHLGRMAEVGDGVDIGGARFEVTAMDGRRVAEVLVRLAQPS